MPIPFPAFVLTSEHECIYCARWPSGPFSRCLDAETARRLVELRVAPTVQKRIDILAERAIEGVLTDDERAEYEALINAADFISILKRKASRHLDSNNQ